VLKRIQLTEELELEEALHYAHNPTPTSPVYPFGDIPQQRPPPPHPTTLGKRGGDQTPPIRGRQKRKVTPQDDKNNRKFSNKNLHHEGILSYNEFATLVPKPMQTVAWFHTFLKLNAKAVFRIARAE
jgi:hypothetical protein